MSIQKKITLLSLLTAFFVFSVKTAYSKKEKTKETAEATWLKAEIGIIGTASADILESALKEVTKNKHAGLIIQLDTPGGALDSTRAMVKSIMAAPFPIIVWVGPSGSRAASAGAFITLSAHIAAMAPGTNIGAAHPIKMDGKDITQQEGSKKVENDTVAFIDSIAKARGRNEEMATSFVITSVSITAKEALENRVIDYIADDIKTLFKKIDGKEIELQSKDKITLATANATTVDYKKSVKQQLLEILSNPNLFYLLFIAGLIGLGFELTHPGVIFPGVAGGICLILAFIAMSVIPINFGALALVLLGIAFLIAEIFVPSYGSLGIGGIVAFVIGSFLLVDPSNELGLRISLITIAPGAIAVAAAAAIIGYLVVRTQRSKVKAGVEEMIDLEGIVLQDFIDRKGRVRISGEDWAAVLQGPENLPLKKGDSVIVKKVEGLYLYVIPKLGSLGS